MSADKRHLLQLNSQVVQQNVYLQAQLRKCQENLDEERRQAMQLRFDLLREREQAKHVKLYEKQVMELEVNVALMCVLGWQASICE